MIKIDKIQLNNFRFFIDDENNNIFEPNGENLLIYGENGSGKSSIYKAFEFLITPDVSEVEFNENKNIFMEAGETFLKFNFSNDEELRIDDAHLTLEGEYNFIEKISIPKPILDYKSLLKVTYDEHYNSKHKITDWRSYTETPLLEKKNLYDFFGMLLNDYPVEDKTLKELSGEEYFNKYKEILEIELFDDINRFLTYFKHDMTIASFESDGYAKTTFLNIELFSV